MIQDAYVTVLCDNPPCPNGVDVCLNNPSEPERFDHSDGHIRYSLVTDHRWILQNGEHFCSQDCLKKHVGEVKP